MKSVEYSNQLSKIGNNLKMLLLNLYITPSQDDLIKLDSFNHMDNLSVREKSALINWIVSNEGVYGIKEVFYSPSYEIKDEDIPRVKEYLDFMLNLGYNSYNNHRFMTDYTNYMEIICKMNNKMLTSEYANKTLALTDIRVLRAIKFRMYRFDNKENAIAPDNEERIISYLVSKYKTYDISRVNEIIEDINDRSNIFDERSINK